MVGRLSLKTGIGRDTAKTEGVAKLVLGKNVDAMPEPPQNVSHSRSSADTDEGGEELEPEHGTCGKRTPALQTMTQS